MRVQQAFVNHLQEWVIGGVGQSHGALKITVSNSVERATQRLCIGAASQISPPQRPLDNDDQCPEESQEDRPHERPALDEEVHNDIGQEDVYHDLNIFLFIALRFESGWLHHKHAGCPAETAIAV